MDNLDIFGILIIKNSSDTYNVLTFSLEMCNNHALWRYRAKPDWNRDIFDIENIREAYIYAVELSKRFNLPFVGYRNVKIDPIAPTEGGEMGYPFYSPEFLKWFSSTESAT